MTKRKRRPRPSSSRGTLPRVEASPPVTVATPTSVQQPPWGRSLVRGMATVGRSPTLLGAVLLGALALWLLYSASSIVHTASPGVMAQIESLAPVHTVLDVEFLQTAARVLDPPVVVLVGAGIVLVHAAVTAFVVAFGLSALSTEGGDRDHLGEALLRVRRCGIPMIGAELVFLAVGFAMLIVGSLLGSGAALLALVAATYFLVYAPVALVAEGAPLADAFRHAMRAPRVPGRSHLLFAVVYPFACLLLASRSGTSVTATPSVLVWAYALVVTFVHASVLVALTYRWLVIRGPVVDGPLPPSRWRITPNEQAAGRR